MMDYKFLKKTALICLVAGFLFMGMAISVPTAHAETCIECHENPKYDIDDRQRLEPCLACHGRAGHPLKKEATEWSLVNAARASSRVEKTQALKSHTGKGHDIKTDASKQVPGPTRIAEMIYVGEGEFLMGSDDRLRDEKPAHVVYIDAFYIDKHEVPNADYKEFVQATGHPQPNDWESGTYPKNKGDNPVIYVDWYDSVAFCKWRHGARLPREREWEKAARTEDGRIYPWGDRWDLTKSNNPLRGHEGTMPIGSFEQGKNPYGLYDMSGNVWEWVDDDYLPHPGSDYVNPEFEETYKMLKGGSWWDCMFYGCGISAPTYNRSLFLPETKNDSYGFRCAADAE